MDFFSPLVLGGIALGAILLLTVIIPMMFRVVVPTNEVHIIQTGKDTVSYGKGLGSGNAYYLWPSWIPHFGVQLSVFPTSVFDVDLHQYEAYDSGRIPFLVDVKAFFRITDSNTAAQRVASFEELGNQLQAIVQGAVRAVLASKDIEVIMEGRGEFGSQFTAEVKEQLANWGVEPVNNIELMDIKDAKDSKVISDIMAKKKSLIEKESRETVAANNKAAQIAQIQAKREIELAEADKEQIVGLRKAEAQRKVEIANEERMQALKEQERITKEKSMAISQVEAVKSAEIEKEVQVISAKQAAETKQIDAENQKITKRLIAEGKLESDKMEAEGIEAKGKATGEAKAAELLAPVTAQTTLASKIAELKEYQVYLTNIEEIKAKRDIGIEQAKALGNAEIKILANTGSVDSGIDSISKILSAQGGSSVGMMIEGFANTDAGKSVLKKLGIGNEAE